MKFCSLEIAMLPILSSIPDPIKKQITDSLVDFIANQAEKLANDQIAAQIRKFSSQNDFISSVEKAIHRGSQRFIAEYIDKDEDLVDAISKSPDFWTRKSVQKAITTLVKQPGSWTVDEQLELVTHFEDVLPERRNRARVDQAVAYFLRCVVEELWTLPGAKEVRDVYALQFQKITAETVREQAMIARQQLEATVQLNSDMRHALMQLTEALEKNLLTAPETTALLQSKPYHNLPRPDYSRFVGRTSELNWIRQRLRPDDRAWQVAINGIGGVGKSALALTIAHELKENYENLPKEQRFDAIIWISAKEDVLTVSGKERANLPELVLRTLEDVYAAIARVLDREDITRALPREQAAVVEKALREQRTLLIMDNLESVKDERIKPFLRNLPSPTKVIITSREWLEVADVLSLKGLSETEADQLIYDESKLRAINLTVEESKRLYDLTSGIPLPLKLSVARISGGESFGAVTRWLGNATGDLPEYCIKGQAELARQRDPNAYKLLLACSLFDRTVGASRDSLGYITDLSIADRDSGLAQLQRLFLINQTKTDRFWILPIVQRFAQSQIQASELAVVVSRWLGWLIEFSKEYASELEWNVQNIQSVAVEYPNLLEAIRWCAPQSEYYEKLILLSDNIWAYPRIVGRYNELKEIIDAGLSAAKTLHSTFHETRFLRLTGLTYWLRDQYKESLSMLDAAEELAISTNNFAEILECWYLRVHILAHQDIQLAESYVSKTNALLEKIENETVALRLRVRLAERNARVEYRKGNIDKALDMANQVIELSKPTGESRSLAWGYYFRGTMLFKKKQYLEAESALNKCIKMGKVWEEQRLVAFSKRRLAWLYSATQRISLSRLTAEEAIEIFKRLDLKDEIIELEGLLKDLSSI